MGSSSKLRLLWDVRECSAYTSHPSRLEKLLPSGPVVRFVRRNRNSRAGSDDRTEFKLLQLVFYWDEVR
jgi:hypothetical protein